MPSINKIITYIPTYNNEISTMAIIATTKTMLSCYVGLFVAVSYQSAFGAEWDTVWQGDGGLDQGHGFEIKEKFYFGKFHIAGQRGKGIVSGL